MMIFSFVKKQQRTSSIILFLVGCTISLFAQKKPTVELFADSLTETRMVFINNIFLIGNKKTKNKIILRELSIKKGNTYNFNTLKKNVKTDQNKIYNTKLFNEVKIEILELDYDKVDISIRVDERWYFFPIPLLDIIDRNFSDWGVNHGYDLKRLIYGLSLYHFNMRGMNEQMTITAQLGFTKKFGINYAIPYIDKNQKHGLSFSGKYSEYNNLHYTIVKNKRKFIETDDILKTTIKFNAKYTLRNSFYTRHGFEIGYSQNEVADTILRLNKNYLGTGTNKQKYFIASYFLEIDKRDIAAYPLSGYKFSINIYQTGLGLVNNISKTNLTVDYAKYFNLKKGFFFSNLSKISMSTPPKQPYTLLYGLGFENTLIRGYELYTVFAQNYFLNKSTFKKVLLKGSKKWKSIPIDQFQYIPYALYFKTYFDIGYAENTSNLEGNTFLSDNMLTGIGFGFDFVTMYDFIIRAEYSFNNIGESGFFLNFFSNF